MAETQKKKLLFIKSPAHNLKAIETFLTKRNFDVIFETDLDSSLIKIEALIPDFIFIAWDHPNTQVTALPNSITAMTSSLIIPYVQSNSKDAIRRLEFSGFSQKLYPPLSGPAIERLVLKALKSLEIDPNAFKSKSPKINSNDNEVQKISSSSSADSGAGHFSFGSNGNLNPQDSIVQKGTRGELLKTKNQTLIQLQEKTLARPTKEKLKSDFENSIKQSFEDMIETYHDTSTDISTDLSPAITTESANESQTLTVELEQVRRNSNREQENDQKNQNRSYYCMTIQSTTWCGYLVAYSDFNIDFSLSQHLFRQWLSAHFENLQEFEDSEQFEINISHADYKLMAEESSDYFETVKLHDKEVILSFFTVDPQLLLVDLHDRDLIGVPLEIIPPGRALPLSFYLHLPENQKYLLYTPVHQTLDNEQHRRLTEKHVQKLYTPIEFEREFRILRAESFLNSIPSKLKTGS